jgi:type I restriction enzyme S subunit
MIGSRIDDRSRLPPEWSIAAVGQIGSYLNGHAFKPSQWTNEGLPIIRIQNLTDHKKPFNYFAGKVPDRYLINSGDILVSWSASLGAFRWTRGKAWLNQHIFKATPNTDLTDDWFFYYLMRHAIERIAKNARGSTMRHVTHKEFVQAEVALPPLKEQRQIAAVLSAVQWAIERQERLIALTTELKKALTHKLFIEGTRGEPLKETEIGPVPLSWDVVPLGSLAKIGNGSTPKRDNFTYWEDGVIPWLTSGKIHEGRINRPEEYVTELAKAECHLPLVPAGSVLVAITGEGKTLGNAALVEFDTCVSQHLAYVQFRRDDVIPAFILYFLQRQYAHLRQMSVGAGSTKKALTCGLLKRYLVPLPMRGEQTIIATALDTVVAKLNKHEGTVESLRSLFRTLLQALMTAQVRVHDLDVSALEDRERETVGAA